MFWSLKPALRAFRGSARRAILSESPFFFRRGSGDELDAAHVHDSQVCDECADLPKPWGPRMQFFYGLVDMERMYIRIGTASFPASKLIYAD